MKNAAFTLIVVALFALSVPARAEPELINTFKDWDAFVSGEGANKTCYIASVPKKSLPAKVRHGNVYMTVAHKPRRKIRDEVNVVAGYSFKADSQVRAISGATAEDLFVSGNEAWAYDPKMDGRLVAAMKRGASMVVRGTSERGTKTSYEFSLFGFSAAYAAISKACKIG